MNKRIRNSEHKEEATGVSQVKERGLLFSILSLISFIVIPLLLLITILFTLLTNGNFYTSILKNIDLISTFIYAKNWQLEDQIKREIERDVRLEEFVKKFEIIKTNYEATFNRFHAFNRTTEYENLKREREELSKLSWRRAPSTFVNKSDFKKYKEEQLKKQDILIDEIEKFRDMYEDEIDRLKDEMKYAKKAYKDAQDKLNDKKKDAEKIILSHKNSFMNKIYSDAGIISPLLSQDLNKFIDIAVKNEIEMIIHFLTSYYKHKDSGNVFEDKLEITSKGIRNTKRVRFPKISLSIWVDEEVNGVLQKRHLFSHIFVEKIQNTKKLHNQELFIKLFKFSETGLGERLGRFFLKKANLSIKSGIITIKPVVFTGNNANLIEKIMICMTWGDNIKYFLPFIALLLLALLISSKVEKERKYKSIRRILIYPSLLFITIAIAIILLSSGAINFYSFILQSQFMQLYLKKIIFVASLHIFVPIIIIYSIITLIGFFIRSRTSIPEDACQQ